ncbi:MAG: S8 family peptidase [Cyclobacteriaceae bacterium]
MGIYKSFIIVLFLLVAGSSYGQMNRYVVFLSDKDNTPFAVDKPEEFLSQRAIDRRSRMNIDITEQDLPVDPAYVSQIASTGADVYFTSKWFNAVLTQMHDSELAAVEQLSFVDSVVFVAPNELLGPMDQEPTVAADFIVPTKINAKTGTQLRVLGSDVMHDDGYRGEGVLIAVFDDGFQGVNEFEPFGNMHKENRLVATKDFIANSGNVYQYDDHGSSVLSCIASNYGEDLIGTAPKASYILCVTEDLSTEYRIEEYNWLLAAEFADSAGVDVINGSLGYSNFTGTDMDYSLDDMDGSTTIVAQAAKITSEKGIVVVVSAGNSGNSSWGHVTSPGDAFDVLTVGSITLSGGRSSFSSYGPTADGRIKPDVVALGSAATIFYMSNGEVAIASGNGTSFSAPQVAGFAAGVIQAHPTWTNLRVIEAIKATGNKSTLPDTLVGYGTPKYPLKEFDNVLSVYPNPLDDEQVTINFGDLVFNRELHLVLYDNGGKVVLEQVIAPEDISQKLDLELTGLRSGLYFLSLRSKRFKEVIQLKKL